MTPEQAARELGDLMQRLHQEGFRFTRILKINKDSKNAYLEAFTSGEVLLEREK